MTRSSFLAASIVAAGIVLTGGGAVLAQDYPAQPVNVVIPFPPGGGTDTIGRIVFNKVAEGWSEPVVIQNQPGASGLVGTLSAMREAPDGYTLIMGSTGSILSLAREGMGMDSGAFQIQEVLTPVTQLSADPYVVAVHPSLGVESIEELVALAKSDPDAIPFGSSGIGSASHLTGVLFEQLAGVELRHVPYSGTGEAVPALLGGDIKLMFAPPSSVLPHAEDGALIALAVTSEERSALHPDLPTVAEGGVAGFSAIGWFGLYAPTGVEPGLLEAINTAVTDAMADPAVVEALANQGAAPAPMLPDEYRDWVNADVSMWLELAAIAEAEE
ncbi:Bug family tripartite tricarboxylate transporter substrate binding protein [Pelagibacterium sediminicola]|uniref:Bug family tripartite tricarboxylate transporter substrate binding protein n=1 Tax=Pelagibacterium sediminicola TaxID=2248761 RepID=UPI000E314F06|nr:tripartite tricarboxylate transporter substrate binding protein [Pelagibacterium sediminicola]